MARGTPSPELSVGAPRAVTPPTFRLPTAPPVARRAPTARPTDITAVGLVPAPSSGDDPTDQVVAPPAPSRTTEITAVGLVPRAPTSPAIPVPPRAPTLPRIPGLERA
jgi:hypothetical protein